MKNSIKNTKYEIKSTSKFNKQLRKASKQNKDLGLLLDIVVKLANKEPLDERYKDHQLINNKTYKNCRECHITPDWLLVYKYSENTLVLLLFATRSHSELFNK